MSKPAKTEQSSGKVLVRLPKSLHQQCKELAQQEGVSLNQYIVTALARTVGWYRRNP